MAIPEEGFPARVLMRLEAHEKRQTRTQWLITLATLFLGSLAALVWLGFNWNFLVDVAVFFTDGIFVLTTLVFAFLSALVRFVGQGPLLIYAAIVLVMTVLWARLSGGFHSPTMYQQG
jgi:hypothetical protein